MSVNYLKRQKCLCFGKLKYMAPPCSINLDFIHNRCPAEWRFSVRKKWYIVVTGHAVVMNWSPMNSNAQFCLAMFLLVFHSFKSTWCTVFFRITKILHILFNTNIIFLSMLRSYFLTTFYLTFLPQSWILYLIQKINIKAISTVHLNGYLLTWLQLPFPNLAHMSYVW